VKLHVFGASGSGTTTLGRALAERFGLRHIDADDYFWLPTSPPFQDIRPREERQQLLFTALDVATGWVLSGSATGWGDSLMSRFDLAVFLTLEHKVRMQRLIARERTRYGDARLGAGGDMHESSVKFLSWAAAYDTAGREQRSRALHEEWIAHLPCPVMRLDAVVPTEALVDAVFAESERLGQSRL